MCCPLEHIFLLFQVKFPLIISYSILIIYRRTVILLAKSNLGGQHPHDKASNRSVYQEISSGLPILPSIALAAATAGLARYTSDLVLPILPTKLRFVVGRQRSPA